MTGLLDRWKNPERATSAIESEGLLDDVSQSTLEMQEGLDTQGHIGQKSYHIEYGRAFEQGHTSANHTRSHSYLQYIPPQIGEIDLSETPGHLARWARQRTSRDITTLLRRICLFLLPSFLSSRISSSSLTTVEKKLYPTSHLDGLRGIAAFFVCVYHLSYVIYPSHAYGLQEGAPSDHRHFVQLPIVNLFYMGHPHVAVFFIVSGYSLSVRPLKQMRAGDWGSLHSTISSAAFRRGFRLYIPVFFSTLLIMLLIDVGAYEMTRHFANSDEFLRNWREFHMFQKESWWAQATDWWSQFCRQIWIFDFDIYGGSNYYDYHLWTIAVEFRCSLVLFLCQIAFSRMYTPVRISGLCSIAWFAWSWGRWDVFLFLVGCVLAEMDLVQVDRSPVGWHAQSKTKPLTKGIGFWSWHLAGLTSFVVGLYLMAYPENSGGKSPGYVWLHSLIPNQFDITQQSRPWPAIGGVFYVGAVNNVKLLSYMFTTPPVQYLGKISYGLYLMHGPVIHTLGYALEMSTFKPVFGFTRDDVYSTLFNTVFVLEALLILFACVCAGDVFYRAVDIPAVRFARWVEGRCVRKDA